MFGKAFLEVEERDLGAIISTDLKYSKQTLVATQKAVLDFITRNFHCYTSENIIALKLYSKTTSWVRSSGIQIIRKTKTGLRVQKWATSPRNQ